MPAIGPLKQQLHCFWRAVDSGTSLVSALLPSRFIPYLVQSLATAILAHEADELCLH